MVELGMFNASTAYRKPYAGAFGSEPAVLSLCGWSEAQCEGTVMELAGEPEDEAHFKARTEEFGRRDARQVGRRLVTEKYALLGRSLQRKSMGGCLWRAEGHVISPLQRPQPAGIVLNCAMADGLL